MIAAGPALPRGPLACLDAKPSLLWGIRMDPVKARVALPAADPPDNAHDQANRSTVSMNGGVVRLLRIAFP